MVTLQIQPDVFHAVADATRRAILDRLRDGEKPVTEIASAFPVSRPAISKHLRVLLDASLVAERHEGRHHIYRLNPGRLRDLDQWLESYRHFWSVNLAGLKRHVESKEEKR